MTIDGILNLDKPRGKTSFQVVAVVRRLSGERRVGHGGTLDPEATGVLPVCLGQGTRVVEFLAEARKIYHTELELGVSTDTYDAAGEVTGRSDPSELSKDDIEAAVDSFKGLIEQLPPIYSAVKYKGVPLYRWARSGIDVPRKARKVEYYRIDILDWKLPLLTLEVECSKGAYIRSLAHDLGEELGCGAYVRNLIRTRSGPFNISDSVAVSQLEEAFQKCCWQELMYPIDIAVSDLPLVTFGDEDVQAIMDGRSPAWERDDWPSGERCRAYSSDGRFIAVLRRDEEQGCWRPMKVFARRNGRT